MLPMDDTNDIPFTLNGGENAVPSGGMNLCFYPALSSLAVE